MALTLDPSKILRPIHPLSQDGYQFFPLTHYSQIIMADGSRWNGISVDKVVDEEGNEIFKMPTDKSLLIDGAPADAKITGQRIDACLLKSGGIMTGTLSIDRTTGVAATIDFINNTKPIARLTANTNGNRFTFWQFNAAGAYEYYQLPIVKVDEAIPEDNQHLILTSKMPVTIEQGGTGATDATTALVNLGALPLAGGTITGPLVTDDIVTLNKQVFAKGIFNSQGTFYAESLFHIRNGNYKPTLHFSTYQLQRGQTSGSIVYAAPDTTNGYTARSRFQFQQFSYNGSLDAVTTVSETFNLPDTAEGLASSESYNILTTKSPVTVAQGGTGATTAAAARAALGAVNKSDIEIALPVSGWDSNGVQTVSVEQITTESSVLVAPNPSVYASYHQYGVYCSDQGDGTLSFKYRIKPEIDLVVNTVIFN